MDRMKPSNSKSKNNVAKDMPRLAQLIKDKKERILKLWKTKVLEDPDIPSANKLTEPLLTDHMPAFLDELAEGLSKETERSGQVTIRHIGQGQSPPEHAKTRALHGYATSEVLTELAHLRTAIIAECGVRELDFLGPLHAALDKAMSTVATEIRRFRGEQEKRSRQMESDLQKVVQELERANAMKDLFLATLSHELRNPLNVISGYVELLKSSNPVHDRELYDEALELIDRNTQIQTTLVDDLLDISRIISGKIALDKRAVPLAEVVQAAVASIRLKARFKQVKVTQQIRYEGNVMGDSSRLYQIVTNLLNNALKFTPEEGSINVAIERTADQIELVVTDSGRGIPPEMIDRIFDLYRQSETQDSKKFGGLGLGLFLVKSLVELHGGSVKAESSGEGQGATFRICFPAP